MHTYQITNHLKTIKMSQLVKFICSLITAIVMNVNTTSHEIINNEQMSTANSIQEICLKRTHLVETLFVNTSKSKE